MVIMDEPHAKSIYGGTLAAPVFKKVMERSFKYMATKNQLGNASDVELPSQLEESALQDDSVRTSLAQ